MENVLTVAAYVCNRYRETYGERIDEMKLHKLMYFAQREALIQTDQPLFDATIIGSRLGPVLMDLRDPYKDDAFQHHIPEDVVQRIKPVIDSIFEDYAGKDSWSLSRLSHGEISWKKSRQGIDPSERSNNPMPLEDIRLDAIRIKERREMLKRYGLL